MRTHLLASLELICLAYLCHARRLGARTDNREGSLFADETAQRGDHGSSVSSSSIDPKHVRSNTRRDATGIRMQRLARFLFAFNPRAAGISCGRSRHFIRPCRRQFPISPGMHASPGMHGGPNATITPSKEYPAPVKLELNQQNLSQKFPQASVKLEFNQQNLSQKSSQLKKRAEKGNLPPKPASLVGVDGGDAWTGQRIDEDELKDLVEEARSTKPAKPIIAQYYTDRFWLWRQWSQTVVQRTLRNEVLVNAVIALFTSLAFRSAPANVKSWLNGLYELWRLAISMTTFPLAFFLTGSYAFYRSVHSRCREVQQRLYDMMLEVAQCAERDATTGTHTSRAQDLLATIVRYVRVFHMLFYASVTKRFAPLRTPQGISAIKGTGLLSSEEAQGINTNSLGHETIMIWLSALFDTAIQDGRLGPFQTTPKTSLPPTVPFNKKAALQQTIQKLRKSYSPLKDQIAARMPLAYVQLMQFITDGVVLFTPFALLHTELPIVGVVFGTVLITLLYSSILTLAKLFLDPLNNEIWRKPGYADIVGIEVATLLQETSLNCERWLKVDNSWLPLAVRPQNRSGAPVL